MSATEVYETYLLAIVGKVTGPEYGDAPSLIAHRLGEMARAKNEMPDDRVTGEATVATLNGTGRGFGLDAAAAYLKVSPVPTGREAQGTPAAEWLARAVQALGAVPEAKS